MVGENLTNWLSQLSLDNLFSGDFKGLIPDLMTQYLVWPSVLARYSQRYFKGPRVIAKE